MRKKLLCVFLCLSFSVVALEGCAGTDDTVTLTEDTQEVTNESVTEEIKENNEIYYLSESYLIGRLDSFISFCRYYAEPSTEHEYWGGEFSQLVSITMENKSNLGVVNIYETNPNIIVTEAFAEKAKDSGYRGIREFFKAIQHRGNSVSCYGSNIHETWHYYAGTDAKAYIGYTVGSDSFVIEMAQSASSPNAWIINDILLDYEAHDKLGEKLVNEDGVEWETQPTVSYADLYQNYANENLLDEAGFYLVDSNQDKTPECIYRLKNDYGLIGYVVLVASEDGSIFRYDFMIPEVDETRGEYSYIQINFDEASGHFYVEKSINGVCHIQSSVSKEYDDLVDYSSDFFLISYVDEYDTEVEYARYWYSEYAVSEDGKSFDLVNEHYFFEDIFDANDIEQNSTYGGTLWSYDGIVGGVSKFNDTYPEWWGKLFADYTFSNYSSSYVDWLYEKIYDSYGGTYEDYKEELENVDNISWYVCTSDAVGLEDFLTAESEHGNFIGGKALDFTSSWADFDFE